MIHNLLVVGLSGSGVVLFNRVLTECLADKGLTVTTKDALGTAHRATQVITEIRYSEDQQVFPNFIPYGEAQVVVGFEPLETLRLGALYVARDGAVFMNTHRVIPTFHSMGKDIFSNKPRPLGYPDNDDIIRRLRQYTSRIYPVDATGLATACGHHMASNVVMLGAVTASGLLPVSAAEIEDRVERKSPRKTAEVNLRAFQAGLSAWQELIHGARTSPSGRPPHTDA
ncbi:MAG: 2-oxoacid:acceptor oxidoreductase family protein [Candidatus Methylomirabilia bacterium]